MAGNTKKKKTASGSFWKVFVGEGRNGDISLSFFAYVMILLVV